MPAWRKDLVQDTFLAAYKARDRFSAKSSERTWLVGILRHKIYDHLRHACRGARCPGRCESGPHATSQHGTTPWSGSTRVAAESAEPSRRLELAEFRANLETALGKLPPRVAQCSNLYEVEDVRIVRSASGSTSPRAIFG